MLRKVKREAGQDGITSARKRAGTIFKSGGRRCRGVGAPVQYLKVAGGLAGALMRRYNFQKWQPALPGRWCAGTISKSGSRCRRRNLRFGATLPARFPVWGDLAGAISYLGRPCRRDFLKCPFLPQNGTNPPHIYTFIVIYEIKCKINGNFSQNYIIYMDYLHYFALKNVKSVPFLSKI